MDKRQLAKQSRAILREAKQRDKHQSQIAYLRSLEAMLPPSKDKGIASVLSILLGTFGAQFFYLERPLPGVVCLLLCWTGIPTLIGICHGISIAFQSHDDWSYEHQPSHNLEFFLLVAERHRSEPPVKSNFGLSILLLLGLACLFAILSLALRS